MRRHELSDEEWALVGPLLSSQARGGRWNDHHTTLGGMLWILRTGAPWLGLPKRFGPWQSIYHRFIRWRGDGTFDRIMKALRMCLDREGRIDWDLWCVDGTSARASRSAAGAPKGAGRRARRPRAGPLARRMGHEAPPGR
jgi:transposase